MTIADMSAVKLDRSIRVVSIARVVALLAMVADAEAQAFNVQQLEQDFAADRGMRIVNSVEQLPRDVLESIGFQKRAIANLGEAWHSSGDVDVEDPATMPEAQHIFSAVSDRHFFVLVQLKNGRWSSPKQDVKLILGERNAEHFCTYVYRNLTIRTLRLDIFKPDFDRRDRVTRPTHPDCVVQSRPQ